MRDLPDQLILDVRLNATGLRKLKKRGREKEGLLGQSEPKRKVTVASRSIPLDGRRSGESGGGGVHRGILQWEEAVFPLLEALL